MTGVGRRKRVYDGAPPDNAGKPAANRSFPVCILPIQRHGRRDRSTARSQSRTAALVVLCLSAFCSVCAVTTVRLKTWEIQLVVVLCNFETVGLARECRQDLALFKNRHRKDLQQCV